MAASTLVPREDRSEGQSVPLISLLAGYVSQPADAETGRTYVIRDSAGVVVYVGWTSGLVQRRLLRHRLDGTAGLPKDDPGGWTVAVSLEPESDLIARYRPRFNVMLKPPMPSADADLVEKNRGEVTSFLREIRQLREQLIALQQNQATQSPAPEEMSATLRADRHRSLLRPKVLARKLGISVVTLWRWSKANGFPQPFRVGRQAIAWDEGEIEEWLESRRCAPLVVRKAQKEA